MKAKYLLIYLVIFSSILIFFTSTINKSNIEFIKNKFDPLPQVIKTTPIRQSYKFAGEPIPIQNFDIKERLDRELLVNSYYHSASIQNIKLSKRFFPVIEKILKKYNVPDDFKYLAVAESGLRNVVSPAGATGYWQLMKPLAKEMGLEVYEEVDERYDLVKSTETACKYLLQLKNKYGSWINATAAYNLGITKFYQAINKEKEKDFLNMNLNEETMRYLFRILAIKDVIEHPEQYGFYIDEADKYEPLTNYYNVKVDSTIDNLGDFAHKYGITYRKLKIYNPWLRSHKLTVKTKTYLIKIPR
ncbi:MAG TPA: lytic transglycosylase domain-containing protein [Bacteroidetes bacterium]|nr:lytic transglycosylase domain-containing protein [Bacteroidota bacterium]